MFTAMLSVDNIYGAHHDIWTVNVEQEYHEEGSTTGTSGTGRGCSDHRMTVTATADAGAGHAGSVSRHFACFDGLRAIAATLIVAHHAGFASGDTFRYEWGVFLGRMDIGVPIFFALSGFLLFRPYVAAQFAGVEPIARRRLLDPTGAAHLPRLLGGAVPAGDHRRHRRAQHLRPARVHEPHADLLPALRDRCDHAVVEPRDRDQLLRVPAVLGDVDAASLRRAARSTARRCACSPWLGGLVVLSASCGGASSSGSTRAGRRSRPTGCRR